MNVIHEVLAERLLWKSSSSPVSGSGPQTKKSVTDTGHGMHAGHLLEMDTLENATLPRAPSANAKRRIVVK